MTKLRQCFTLRQTFLDAADIAFLQRSTHRTISELAMSSWLTMSNASAWRVASAELATCAVAKTQIQMFHIYRSAQCLSPPHRLSYSTS